jgi:hypothetical protein
VNRVPQDDVAALLEWLAGKDPNGTGYDQVGWEDSVWVLHAMFERDGLPDDSHLDWRLQARDEGIADPTRLGSVDIAAELKELRGRAGSVLSGPVDGGFIPTGIPLGFVRTPPQPPWHRLRWSEFAVREGLVLGSDWPAIPWFPESFPVRILPPPESSLDEASLVALIRLLTTHSGRTTGCVAYYSAVSTFGDDTSTFMFTGELGEVPTLLADGHAMRDTPTNLWPDDRSWFVYTDSDLMATKVSGPARLIAAIIADPTLETMRWHPHLGLFLRHRHAEFVLDITPETPGAPTITFPTILGWSDTVPSESNRYPQLQHAATSPDAATAYVVVSRLERTPRPKDTRYLPPDADLTRVIDFAPGELFRQFDDFVPFRSAAETTLDGLSAYRHAGTYRQGTDTMVVHNLAVVAPVGTDGEVAYFVQFWIRGRLEDREALDIAAHIMFSQSTIQLPSLDAS